MNLIPFLSKSKEPLSSSSSWPWPTCGSSRTRSFRAENIMNSGFVAEEFGIINLESSVNSIVSTEVEEEYSGEKSIENVIREVRESSGRIFFDHPGGETTSCIVGNHHSEKLSKSKNSNINDCVGKSSDEVVLIEMDSRNPFEDFKKSMEEMVGANGFNLKDDWKAIYQLLSWYLKVNDTSNHGYIVGALVDLLVSLDSSSSSCSSSDSPSNLSFRSCDEDHKNNFSTSSSCATVTTQSPISTLSLSSNYSGGCCLLTLFEEEEEEEEEDDAEDEDEEEKGTAALDHHHQDVKKQL